MRIALKSSQNMTSRGRILAMILMAVSLFTASSSHAMSFTEATPGFASLPDLRPAIRFALSTSVSVVACQQERSHVDSYVQRGIYKLFGQTPPPASSFFSKAGSGVVIDLDQGLILTAAHVVDHAEHLHVRFPGHNGKVSDITARLVALDLDMDIAVLSVDAALLSGRSAAEMIPYDAPEIGSWVIAVGDPVGLTQSASLGIVSGSNRSQNMFDRSRNKSSYRTQLIQTDALTRPGSSGGPLFSGHGELLGIVIGGGDGMSFSVPIARAMQVVQHVQT